MTPQPVQYTRLDLAEISENLQPYMRQMSEEWPLCVQADIGTETDVVEEVRKRDYIRREGTTIPLALAQLPFQCSTFTCNCNYTTTSTSDLRQRCSSSLSQIRRRESSSFDLIRSVLQNFDLVTPPSPLSSAIEGLFCSERTAIPCAGYARKEDVVPCPNRRLDATLVLDTPQESLSDV
jgi:hypothetical protein